MGGDQKPDLQWLKNAGVLDAIHFTMSSIVELGLHNQDPVAPVERNVYEFAAQCCEKFGSHWNPATGKFDPDRVHTPLPFDYKTPREPIRGSPARGSPGGSARQKAADAKAAEAAAAAAPESADEKMYEEIKARPPTQVTMVSWNLGRPNTNPFEFDCFAKASSSPGAQLIRAINATIRHLVDGPGDGADAALVAKVHKALGKTPLADMTVSHLCAGLQQLTGKNESERVVVECLKECLKDDWGQQKPAEVFKKARKNSEQFTRSDAQFRDRRFTITALATAEDASKYIESCTSSPPCSRWWGLWVDDIAATRYVKDKAAIQELSNKLSGVAMLDGLLAAVASAAITALGLDRAQLAEDLGRVAQGVGVGPAAKGMSTVRALSWLVGRFEPAAISLQNFDTAWLGQEAFQEDWRGLTTRYHVLGPDKKDQGRKTQLLVRKDGHFSVDKEATSAARSKLSSSGFKEELEEALGGVFPAKSVASQVSHLSSFVQGGTFVPAVLTAGNVKVMVVAAHANANGTDSRTAVVAAELLAKQCGAGLMLGMDASTRGVASGTEEATTKGACTEAKFTEFLKEMSLASCLHASPNAKELFSVNKEHTFVTASLAEAGQKERHLADWVLSSASLAVSGKLVNCVGGKKKKLWDPSLGMPGSSFQSDHAILFGQADFAPPKPPTPKPKTPASAPAPAEEEEKGEECATDAAGPVVSSANAASAEDAADAATES